MSTRQLIRSMIPFFILLAGNGFWALGGIIYKSQFHILSSDALDLVVSYGYAISVFLILYLLYYKRGFGGLNLSSFHAGQADSTSVNSAATSTTTLAFPLAFSALLSFGFFFAFSGGLGLFSQVFPEAFASYIYSLNNMTLARSPWLWLYSILLAPTVEEFCFRGLCLSNLTRGYLFPTANLLQAFFFAIIHADPIQIAYAFFLGLILGRVYKHLGGLKSTLIFHMLFNAWNLPLILLPLSQFPLSFLYAFYLCIGIITLLPTLLVLRKKTQL